MLRALTELGRESQMAELESQISLLSLGCHYPQALAASFSKQHARLWTLVAILWMERLSVESFSLA